MAKVSEQKADEIIAGMNVSYSPALALAIVAVVIGGIALFLHCKKPASQAHASLKRLNFFERRRLWRVVCEKVDQVELRRDVYEGVLRIAPSTSLEEVESLYEEAQNQ